MKTCIEYIELNERSIPFTSIEPSLIKVCRALMSMSWHRSSSKTYQLASAKEPPVKLLDCPPSSSHTCKHNKHSQTFRRINRRRLHKMLNHPLHDSEYQHNPTRHWIRTHISNIHPQSPPTNPHRYRLHPQQVPPNR
jgi:hypothetical protein